MNHVGTLLRKTRIKRGFTQSQVAKPLRYTSPQFISNWERGLVHPPPKKFKAIARLLMIDKEAIVQSYLKDEEMRIRDLMR